MSAPTGLRYTPLVRVLPWPLRMPSTMGKKSGIIQATISAIVTRQGTPALHLWPRKIRQSAVTQRKKQVK